MELSQLYYFRTTARLQHFTRAAEQLHISQPSLSKSIANLEEELGAPLFEREGRQVRLTAYGQEFQARVEDILSRVDDAKSAVQDMVLGMRGEVHLASSFPITAPSMVYDYQYRFFAEHPNISLHLHLLDCERMEELLEEREMDFGVSLVKPSRPGIACRALYADQLGLIVGSRHPLAGRKSVRLEELAGEKFLCNSSAPDPGDSARHMCALAGFVPNIIYEGDSADLIGEAVSAGMGISFVSDKRYELFNRRPYIPDWEKDLRYVKLENDFCLRTANLLYPASRHVSAAARLFGEGLVDFCARGYGGEKPDPLVLA